MSLTSFFQSKTFRWIAIALGELILLLLVFQLGLFVGFHKASFNFHWAAAYNRNFGGPPGGFMHDFEGQQFFNAHGTTGSVIQVSTSTIIIKGQDNVEKIITIRPSTTIEEGRRAISVSNVKVDEHAVVIGTPQNDGSIIARMVRIFPNSSSTLPTPPSP